jgi:ribosomal protein S18 acetylase RimI-like enzyme
MVTDWFAPDAFLSGALDRDAWNLTTVPEAGQAEDFLRACAGKMADPRFFASAHVPVAAVAPLALLVRAGFRPVDTNLRFARPLRAGGTGHAGAWTGTVRLATPRDEPEVRRLAGACLTTSRFHLDPRIPDAQAAMVKSAWAGNFFAGRRGQAMVVAERHGRCAGFLLLLVRGTDLVIDLIAVDAPFRRQGAAAAMLGLAETRPGDCRRLLVGTQAANAGSVRFYESQGFRYDAAASVLHAHGGSNAHR